MREEYQENLMRMFPKGFIIVYVTNDDSINYFMNNPDRVEEIFNIEDGLIDAADEEGQ